MIESPAPSPPEYRDDCKVSHSPQISSIHWLPNETHAECSAGFDEWYVFGQPVPAAENRGSPGQWRDAVICPLKFIES